MVSHGCLTTGKVHMTYLGGSSSTLVLLFRCNVAGSDNSLGLLLLGDGLLLLFPESSVNVLANPSRDAAVHLGSRVGRLELVTNMCSENILWCTSQAITYFGFGLPSDISANRSLRSVRSSHVLSSRTDRDPVVSVV